jgi:hypothetical protein
MTESSPFDGLVLDDAFVEAATLREAVLSSPGRRPRSKRLVTLLVVAGLLVLLGTAWTRLEGRAAPRAASATAPVEGTAHADAGNVDTATSAPVVVTEPSTPPPPARVRVVIAVAVDGKFAAGRTEAVKHEAAVLTDWFAKSAGGGGPRFDRDETNAVRVTEARLGMTGDAIRALGDQAADAVISEARRATAAGTDDLVLVYADILRGDHTCGEGAEDLRGAVLWMPECGIYPERGSTFPYGATYLAAHELTHALGAAPTCAPHATHDGHVDDDNRDIIFDGEGDRDWDNLTLDPNHDDYLATGRRDCPTVTQHPTWSSET